jgi:formyltetrahydrofolate-dependent phosphoribosylglycinamide formyltransferase
MAKARVGILISGRGSNMAALVYAAKFVDCPYEVVLVAANDPGSSGLRFAEAEGIATFAVSHRGMKRAEFDAVIDAELRKAGADYVALAGYMRLLSPEFVENWAGRMLNIHPSLLPKYKGLDTHQRAIDAGDAVAGCSVHVVTVELDDGPVLEQIEVAIVPGDTAASLADRILIAEHQLYPRTLARFVTADTRPDALLERLRNLALELPESYEKQSHGTPAFGVEGGKMFAYFQQNHHGDGITAVLVKTGGEEEQAMLIESDPELYYRPAYLGPSGWVGIRLDRPPVDWEHVGQWLGKSWRRAAPKRMTKMLDVADQF